MFCSNCGSPLTEGARFCPSCGASVNGAETPAAPVPPPMADAVPTAGLPLPEGIERAPDGSLCWTYEQSLWKNPSILYTLLKVMLVVDVIVVVMIGVISAITGDFDLTMTLTVGAVVMVISVLLALIGYAVFALISGGKHEMLFIMDETRVIHTLMPKEAERGRRISDAAILVGALTGSLSTMGAGMASRGRETMISPFAEIQSIEQDRGHDCIKVRCGLYFNQVYASPVQYDFVLSHIAAHCPGVKVG